MATYSISDSNIAEIIACFMSEENNYDDYCEIYEREQLSMAEWVYNYKLGKFNKYCHDNYGFEIKECNGANL